MRVTLVMPYEGHTALAVLDYLFNAAYFKASDYCLSVHRTIGFYPEALVYIIVVMYHSVVNERHMVAEMRVCIRGVVFAMCCISCMTYDPLRVFVEILLSAVLQEHR